MHLKFARLFLIAMILQLLKGEPACYGPALGMESGDIPDSKITSPSSLFGYPRNARLRVPDSWCPAVDPNGVTSYIQIDLSQLHRICAVATQGNPSGNRDYVKEYKMAWSKDGVNWQTGEKILPGNTDNTGVKKNSIPEVYARYIRLLPLTWYVHPCMRMELYGEAWPEVEHAVFTTFGFNKRLSDHVIASKNGTTNASQCMRLCLVTAQCKSFNFSHQRQICELNNATAKENGQNYGDKEGFAYYESVQYTMIDL